MKPPYQRVDWRKRDTEAPISPTVQTPEIVRADSWLRWLLFILPLALLLCIAQSVMVVSAENLKQVYMSSTLVAVFAFAVLLIFLLVINPLIRLLGLISKNLFGRIIAPLSRIELMILFAAILVTSGISTFGLTSQIIPIIPTPWNPEWNTPQRGWDEDLLPHLNKNLYITDPEQIRLYRQGVDVPKPPESAPWSEHLTYWQDVFEAIPWSVWFRPLGSWLVFVVACYGTFFFLSYVVLNYWSQREKLIFPLAQLPESLLPEEGENRWWPKLFHTPGFWFGLFISIAVLSWNASVGAEWVAGLDRIRFGMGTDGVGKLVRQTALEGLSYPSAHAATARMQFVFGFFAIGIAFLLPLEISFSIWFYYLFGQAVILVGSWMGYREFPSDWLWFNNPSSGLGAGGLLLFSAVSLWRSVHEYIRLGAGKSLEVRIRLALPVLGLVVCLGIVTGWLMWNNLNFFWALLFIAVTTLVTLGIMRIVAEGGIYWIQSHVSFFHIYKMTGLGKILSPSLLGPLLPIYWILFLDIKTFIAPNVLNAAKMQKDVGGSRVRFHWTIASSIVVSMIVSLSLAIYLAYMRGAQQMSDWFYSQGPQQTMDTARTATRSVPEFDFATTGWYLLGAGWVAMSMLFRRTLFWFPHPIGFIMQVNPLLGPVWFSFFIGWLCKKLVVTYGGKPTFDKARVFFIGLIVGELFAVVVWPILGVLFDFTVKGIDLNRYGP